MDDNDADAAGATATVTKILSDAFKPFQEMPMDNLGAKIRAQSLPSCRMESKVMSSFNNSEASAYSGVRFGSKEGRKGLLENGNLVLQSSCNNELTFFENPVGLGICGSTDATLRNLRLRQSTSQVNGDSHFEFKPDDVNNVCSDETDSAYSSADNNSQVMDDFSQKVQHSDCSRCKNCGHVVGSMTKRNSMPTSYDAQSQNSTRTFGGVPKPLKSVFSGIPEDVGEDMPDLIQSSSTTKRKDLEVERPSKRMKNDVIGE